MNSEMRMEITTMKKNKIYLVECHYIDNDTDENRHYIVSAHRSKEGAEHQITILSIIEAQPIMMNKNVVINYGIQECKLRD